jgi:hypothetical protein
LNNNNEGKETIMSKTNTKMSKRIKDYQEQISEVVDYLIKNYWTNHPTSTLSDLMLIRNLNNKIQDTLKENN